jgi:hypothetical protein
MADTRIHIRFSLLLGDTSIAVLLLNSLGEFLLFRFVQTQRSLFAASAASAALVSCRCW